MSYIGNEETLIELPTIEYLQKNLGYEFVNGEKLSTEMRERDSYGDVILDKRLEKALHRLNHYKEKVYPEGFKAQIVCSSRRACIKYYEAINKYITEVIDDSLEVEALIYSNNEDFQVMREYFLDKQRQHYLIEKFKKPLSDERLAFLVVTDMLLIDFDVPIQQALYIDKPLKGNKLAQSIIRITRPYEDRKQYGYIVDYYGISDYMSDIIDNN